MQDDSTKKTVENLEYEAKSKDHYLNYVAQAQFALCEILGWDEQWPGLFAANLTEAELVGLTAGLEAVMSLTKRIKGHAS